MRSKINHIHIIITGLLTILLFAFIIKKQNDILTHNKPNKGYIAYNHATTAQEAAQLMTAWQTNRVCFNAVKKIVYLDYVWMVFFGGTILYALAIGYYYSTKTWKYLFITGMVLLVLAVTIDIIQDICIYRHLTKNRFSDFRYLTKPKFALLFTAIAMALFAIIKKWKIVVTASFRKALPTPL